MKALGSKTIVKMYETVYSCRLKKQEYKSACFKHTDDYESEMGTRQHADNCESREWEGYKSACFKHTEIYEGEMGTSHLSILTFTHKSL